MEQVATGAAAISVTLKPTQRFRLDGITLHLNAAPTTSQNFTVTLNSNEAAAYDTVLFKHDLTVGSITDLDLTFGEKQHKYDPGTAIDVAWTNTDTKTYGLTIYYTLL